MAGYIKSGNIAKSISPFRHGDCVCSFHQVEADWRFYAHGWVWIVVPRLILLTGRWKLNKETAAEQIVNAIKTGYRLFDGAQDYGNEKVFPYRLIDIRNVVKVFVARLMKVWLNEPIYSS
jgi:hypothetical protein